MTGPDGEEPITDLQYMEWAYSIDPKAKPPPDEPEVPEAGERLWLTFWKLHARRRPGFEFPAPLSYGDFHDWSVTMRQHLSPDEVEVLVQMDDAYLRAVADGMELKRSRDERKQKRK